MPVSIQVVPFDTIENGKISHRYVKVVVRKGRGKPQELVMTKAQFRARMATMKKQAEEGARPVAAPRAGQVRVDPATGLQSFQPGLLEYIKMGFGVELGVLLAEGAVDMVADVFDDADGYYTGPAGFSGPGFEMPSLFGGRGGRRRA